MLLALRLSPLIALSLSGQLMAQDGTVHVSGAVVEPTCQAHLSEVTANGAYVQLSHCSQSVRLQLNEPRGDLPSASYRLTDVKGRPLNLRANTSGDTTGVIRAIAEGGAAADQRNVVLVAEYL